MNLETLVSETQNQEEARVNELLLIIDHQVKEGMELFNTIQKQSLTWPETWEGKREIVKMILELYNGHGVSHILVRPGNLR